jgi:hypothetical protein
MDIESEGFPYLRQKISKISESKMKGAVFLGPKISQLFEDQNSSIKLNSRERRTWKAFKKVCRNFPGKEKCKQQRNCAQVKFHHTVLWDVTWH